MHKGKGVLVDSAALFSLKLCIYFRLFLSFFCLFFLFLSSFVLLYPFLSLFRLFNSSLPFVILLYPFTPSFYSLLSFLHCSAALFCFLLFLNHLFLIICSYFVVLMCLSLCNLLLQCLNALQHVLRAPYHLLIYFPLLYGFH